jgi:hypothetical protein
MKLEKQVCTLEQAKRLKGLGAIQESQCYWRCGILEHVASVNSWGDQQTFGELIKRNDSIWEPQWRDDYEIYSAFTVAELGAMIGKGTTTSSLLYDAVQDQMNRSHSFTICYSPQFLANCIISMLETSRLNAYEINGRLLNA